MKKISILALLFALSAGAGIFCDNRKSTAQQPVKKPAPAQAIQKKLSVKVLPVESDMHEFMEYVFEPPYKRLKGALAAEAIDNAGFKTVKSDGLILAEGGNLLLLRVLDVKGDVEKWVQHAEAVKTHGAALYKAGKAKDAAAARSAFATLLQKCNACHDQFAGGEHQLSP